MRWETNRRWEGPFSQQWEAVGKCAGKRIAINSFVFMAGKRLGNGKACPIQYKQTLGKCFVCIGASHFPSFPVVFMTPASPLAGIIENVPVGGLTKLATGLAGKCA
jgi:hypothetical protein